MNPRIQELAKEAQQYAEWTTPQGLEWFKPFQEKFADLIVRECLDIADEYDGCGSTIVSRIKNHFGVER